MRMLIILVLATTACGNTPGASLADAGSPPEDAAQRGDAQEQPSDAQEQGADAGVPADPPTQTQFGGARPVTLQVPSSYDHATATPLLIVLHGYSASGAGQTQYTGLDRLVETEGILYAAPDGTIDSRGSRFWNATDACCDFENSGVDDVAYLNQLIADISAEWNVDPARIYLFGHSNGGFMSYRLACDSSEHLAAIVSLAGATYRNAARCTPTTPVSVLQLHGTADATVRYDAVCDGAPCPYPSAPETAAAWATSHNGCATAPRATAERVDIDRNLPGDETTIARATGCPMGIDVELWTIENGAHIPRLSDSFVSELWSWLAAHPKPAPTP